MKKDISRTVASGAKSHWLADLKAGFSVSLIALPLSLGIAVASGFPPIAGLFTAIIGGLFVSRFNKSHISITGPAAGLIVVNLAAIESLGQGNNALGYEYTLAAIVFAGAIIVLLGLLKAGKLGDIFPTAVVHGMLAAIGVIIMVKQFYVAVDVKPHGKELIEAIIGIPEAILGANPDVALIGIVSVIILLLHPKIKLKFIKLLPAPLWVLMVAILLEYVLGFEHDHKYSFAGNEYSVGRHLLIHLPENLASGFVMPNFGKVATSAFWVATGTIAIVTALESLLSTIASDSFDPQERKSDLNRGLIAVGGGSSLAGFIGGLPMIAEIVRSRANVNAGARTQWSNFIHGGFLLLFLIVGAPVLDHVPYAALAAMLIVVGFRLASPAEFKHMKKVGATELISFLVTLVIVLLTDLLLGILIGMVVNLILNAIKSKSVGGLFKANLRVEESGDTTTIHVADSLTFSNFLKLKNLILAIDKSKNVIIDCGSASFIDHSALHNLHAVEHNFDLAGRSFKLTGVSHLTSATDHPLSEKRLLKNA
ncbi:MAG: SulP family inorganic anion transporter [Cryomorphaceae bacterium]|nr:SulP family inorganic anion transporter [Cryomorphaceae bacterium]